MFEGVQVKVITLLILFFCWWFSKVWLDGERLSEFASMRTGRDPREDCSDSKLPAVNNWWKSSSDIPTKTLDIARAKYGQMVSRDELSNVYTLDLVSYPTVIGSPGLWRSMAKYLYHLVPSWGPVVWFPGIP